jgi:hypothetical protein
MSELFEKVVGILSEYEYDRLKADAILSLVAEEVEKMKVEISSHLDLPGTITAIQQEARNKAIDDVLALLKGG